MKNIPGTTRVSRRVRAPLQTVYRAFVDPASVAAWLAPGDMRAVVHAFEPREGGTIRMSLVYPNPTGSPGKTRDDTDTFHGTFVELVPFERIVQLFEFESDDPAFAGEMKVTWDLVEVADGTEVTATCEGIPAGIRPEDNEEGSRSSLEKLAEFVE